MESSKGFEHLSAANMLTKGNAGYAGITDQGMPESILPMQAQNALGARSEAQQ
jgi:hypothetical protein